ncbi:MAG: 16S rRNA (cytidine(1402)-2'-O)-methyltransferase [Spirochaetales bacterium]|nr:16S rRNA (cytidine(1402)-2'-O)-methyltransferase [Spirochaetales bacterium]
MAQLFIVATPLGNLKDITLRAIETLQTVDLIAAEDTRHTLGLLNHFEIRKPLISCRAQNEEQAAIRILGELEQGHSVAFVSDAGTPGISDPGARLVAAIRKAGYRVVPIPGPSALTALASVGGFGGRRLIFDGFLSPKPGKRKKQLKEILELGDNCIIYESPFRLVKMLKDLAELAPQVPIVVGRELTKTHEEVVAGNAQEVYLQFSARDSIKGECAVMIGGVRDQSFDPEDERT